MLWDESGEWLEDEPESAKGLHRLLCRPLQHLWQDSPEARARAGKVDLLLHVCKQSGTFVAALVLLE